MYYTEVFQTTSLNGDEGNDRLYGGPGNDTLTGGDGADYFNCGMGSDKVTDYNPAEGDSFNKCEIISDARG